MHFLSTSSKLLISSVLIIATSACSQLSENPDLPLTIGDIYEHKSENNAELINADTANVSTEVLDETTIEPSDEALQIQNMVNNPSKDSDREQNEQSNADATKVTEINTPPLADKSMLSFEKSTQDCPTSFYQIVLPNNGKLCQVFAADLPASMTFHIPQKPAQVVEFYETNDKAFSASKAVKERFIMHSQSNNATLIISPDGHGTQVDILVKNI